MKTTRDHAANLRQSLTRREVIAGAGAMLAVGKLGLAQATRAGEEIIDIHAHIMSKDKQGYPPAPLGGQMSNFARDRPQTFEEYVAQADSAGVSKAAIVQVSTYYGVDDSYLADSIAKNPKRFIGVGSIDTLAPDNVQVLDKWMRRGLSGLRIFAGAGAKDLLINPKAAPVWEYCAEKGITVCVSTQDLEQLRAVVQRYPKVKVVLDHSDFLKLDEGPPYQTSQSFFDMAEFGNFYLKATPTTFRSAAGGKSTPQDFLQKLVAVFGANHIAWGSDLPSAEGPLTKLVAEAKDGLSLLSPADRAMILSGTAKRLYPVLA